MAWWDKAGTGSLVSRAEIGLTIATTAIFSVAGGRVLLTSIVGVISTLVAGAANVRLQLNPTVATATTTNLCAALNINAFPVGDIVTITGVPTDAMIPVAAGAALPNMTMPVVLTVGDIEFVCDAAVGGGVTWSIWYKPLDDAGCVVAA